MTNNAPQKKPSDHSRSAQPRGELQSARPSDHSRSAQPQGERPSARKETFETSLERLEEIVRDLESGEKGLDDSLKLFEDGVSLSRSLTQKLDEVKRRVEVLTKEGKDKLKSRPLEENGGADAAA